jgi:hypothetical protein
MSFLLQPTSQATEFLPTTIARRAIGFRPRFFLILEAAE